MSPSAFIPALMGAASFYGVQRNKRYSGQQEPAIKKMPAVVLQKNP